MEDQLRMEQAITVFLESMKQLCPALTEEELTYFRRGLSVRELKSKELYIHASTIQQELGFIYRGLLRSFYVDHKGNEITVSFIAEQCYATHYTAFITRTQSKYYFQCLEPSVIVRLPYEHIQDSYNKFLNFERYGRLIAEAVLKFQQKRIESFLFETAEERYLNFMKVNPGLFNRVSLSHLASYLGIERQTLTRIRQRITREG